MDTRSPRPLTIWRGAELSSLTKDELVQAMKDQYMENKKTCEEYRARIKLLEHRVSVHKAKNRTDK